MDIREYYFTEDGDRKPGKKGISLAIEEWKILSENMENIEKMVKEASGESVDWISISLYLIYNHF